MSSKRTKSSGTKSCVCDLCGMQETSTVEGTKHRRCGGASGTPRRAKHSAVSSKRGSWK